MRRRTASNGMELLAVGDGPGTMLLLPRRAGQPAAHAPGDRAQRALHAPLPGDAGLTVWTVTRRRGMPAGPTVAPMADDDADVARTELGGRVDLAVGFSYGGMAAQHLAARHPDVVARLALVGAAASSTRPGQLRAVSDARAPRDVVAVRRGTRTTTPPPPTA